MKNAGASKYRHVRGGLDSAVRQAEQRGYEDLMIFDADAHYLPLVDDLAEYVSRVAGRKYRPPPDLDADPNLLATYYPPMYEAAPLLKKMPSEYIKDMYFSTQPLEKPAGGYQALERIFNSFDAENHLMYASDYPHLDFDLPSVVDDLPFLSAKEKRKIMGENAKKVFNLK